MKIEITHKRLESILFTFMTVLALLLLLIPGTVYTNGFAATLPAFAMLGHIGDLFVSSTDGAFKIQSLAAWLLLFMMLYMVFILVSSFLASPKRKKPLGNPNNYCLYILSFFLLGISVLTICHPFAAKIHNNATAYPLGGFFTVVLALITLAIAIWSSRTKKEGKTINASNIELTILAEKQEEPKAE